MSVRVISTRLSVDGEAEFRKELASVNSALKTTRSELRLATAEFQGQANTTEALTEKGDLLRKEIAQQEEKVRALTDAVKDSATAYGDADKRTDAYRQKLNDAKTSLIDMQRELEDTNKYLAEAEDSADGAAKSIDKFGREVKGADKKAGNVDSIGDFAGQLGDLKGVLTGGVVAAGIKEISGAILGVVDSTAEYRKIMGTLETSSAAAGYTAEQTAEAYSYLYGVLGDTQTTATTIANLQAIGLEQDELMQIIDMTTGAWATYGDSIPLDGLSESINETIQAGKVTGTFSDVLNWAGLSEDDFNAALKETKDAGERANLVMKTLAEQGLAETGQAWRENNEEIIEMNEAQSKIDEQMGKLGEILSPVASDLKEFAADALGRIVEVVEKAAYWLGILNDKIKAFKEKTGANAADMQENLENWQNNRKNGTLAIGLDTVPYDGYIAELHKNEAVLTAGDASVWRTLQKTPYRETAATTTEELQKMTAGLAQTISKRQNTGDIVINISAEVGGVSVARKQYRYNQSEAQRHGVSLINK